MNNDKPLEQSTSDNVDNSIRLSFIKTKKLYLENIAKH